MKKGIFAFPLIGVVFFVVRISESPQEDPQAVPEEPTHDPSLWLRKVQHHLAREQADARRDGDAIALEHAATGLRVELDGAGVASLRRDDEDAGVVLRTARVAQGGLVAELPDAEPVIGDCQRGALAHCAHRVEVHQGDVTSWWQSGRDGLEQGWEVAAPLGRGELVVSVVTDPATVAGDALRVGQEGTGFEATQFVAWDAAGRLLRAEPRPTDDGFAVVVDADDAIWPVSIDPVWVPWGWTKLGPQDGAGFGAAVALGGDVNGDGYEDALVGAPGYDIAGAQNVGRVYLYLGGANGLATVAAQTWTGAERGEGLGGAVAFLPDTDGDGFTDAVFGADGYDGGIRDQGAAYVVRGTGAGLANGLTLRLTGGTARRHFGGAVASAGDVNNDGFGDLVVGVNRLNEATTGIVRLFVGGPAGIAAPAFRTWGLNAALPQYGVSLAADDLNGDGYDDVVVGAPWQARASIDGSVMVFHGGAGGPAANPNWTWREDDVGAVVATGDVDGDGAADLIATNSNARVSVFFGGGHLPATPDQTVSTPDEGNIRSLASGGDMDGDGFDDLLIGMAEWKTVIGGDQDGSVALLRGSAAGLRAAPSAVWRGEGFRFTFGDAAAMGDANADDLEDALIGAPGEMYVGDTYSTRFTRTFLRGNAFMISGAPGGPAALQPVDVVHWPENLDVPVGDANGDGRMDFAVLNDSFYAVSATGASGPLSGFAGWESDKSAVCDLNGDGYGDLIFGGWIPAGWAGSDGFQWFPGGPGGFVGPGTALVTVRAGFGDIREANCVGDVNADGFDDLLLKNGESMVQLFTGSAAGPVTQGLLLATGAAGWGGGGTTSIASQWVGQLDVNGDGYGDVVGVDFLVVRTGMMGVWFGGPAGLTATASATWTNTAAVEWRLGVALAAAGDVDGDGFDDVLVSGNDSNGVARVHLVRGSAAGLVPALAASWSAREASGTLTDAPFAGVGDVDGDGYDDIAIGEHLTRRIDRPYGSLLRVFRGGPAGPGANPWWRAPFGLHPYAIAPLGDVNGDGLDDLMMTDEAPPGGGLNELGLFVVRGGAAEMVAPLVP